MAFSFANVASEAAAIGGSPAQAGVRIQDGEELREIQTGQLGFKTLNGEVKVRLLSSPWPSEDPPIPSAQLLSVASSQGILAAAGPDTLIITSTDGIRKSLSAKDGGDIRTVSPLLSIPHERLSHVAFSSDESVLVVSGPHSGGLVAYQADKLKAGNNEVALHINTGSSLRAIVPNPNPQSAHLFAVVTADGQLSIADLSTGKLVEGPNGAILSQSVACASWSNRGKQLVVGTASGTGIQLKPNGQIVTHIPKSTSIPNDVHVSTIVWLEDDSFFTIYTPNSTSADDGIPPSEYYVIERSHKTNFVFHRIPEVLPPFGLERLPTHHFIARLRKFDPHLTDLLLLAATSATDIGIVSKSDQPLSTSENKDDLVTNTFTLTSLEDDTRRAALPLSDQSLDTSPIGMAIDLSSKEPVINPLPSDPEVQETSGPVPNLLVLNNEGILCSWWFIYTDSVKEKTTFSGFESLKATEEIRFAASPPTDKDFTIEPMQTTPFSSQVVVPTASPFSAFTSTNQAVSSASNFGGEASKSIFAAPSLPSSLSTNSGNSGFGTTSKIGGDKPSWTSTGFGSNAPSSTSTSAFGKPAFGAPSSMSGGTTPAFGSTTAFGSKAPAFGSTTSPAFGKTGFGATSAASPFATAGNSNTGSGFGALSGSGGFGTGTSKIEETKQSASNTTTSSGFASYKGAGGFGGSSDPKKVENESPFGITSNNNGFTGFGTITNTQNSWAKNSSTISGFGQMTSKETFGKSQGFDNSGGFSDPTKQSPSGFGTGNSFKLESSFKGDGTAKDDLPAPTSARGLGFGMGLGNLLGDSKDSVSQTHDTEAQMDDNDDQESTTPNDIQQPFTGFSPEQRRDGEDASKNFITPPSTITQPKTTQAPPVSSLFGTSQQQTTTPQQNLPTFSFTSTTPKDTPTASHTLFGTKPITSTTPAIVQKSEPVKSFSAVGNVSIGGASSNDAIKRSSEKAETSAKSPSNDVMKLKSVANKPLPPDPISKPNYTAGDTSSSSNSKDSKASSEPPLPPDFLLADKSATKEAEGLELPEDKDEDELEDEDEDQDELEDEDEDEVEEDGFSSDFEDSGEDVTQDISAADEAEAEQDEDITTEQIQTSPESSYKGGDATSPTGGLFSKVSSNNISKTTRPLFGEVASSGPIFPPPTKVQQSPRSPSPVRQFGSHEVLRPDSRSVSAPLRSGSAINQRKAEYSQSNIAAQAARAREEEVAREKARIAAAKAKSDKIKEEESQTLEDDEDERIQRELALPVQPSEVLDEFITYQTTTHTEGSKTDIPAQIERLYQDINSMIYTTGINARSMSAFMMSQHGESKIKNWPDILHTEAPQDALTEKWSLSDIQRLSQGSAVLAADVGRNQISAVPQKLETCQTLLTKELSDLRSKITVIRKSLHARACGSMATAPLSAEQASVQHDLRKSSAAVQTKLVQIEDALAMMRARLTELAPQNDMGKGSVTSNGQAVQKKPTVEAVTNTIAKMTAMAERKSADVDVLEAQLKKLDFSEPPVDGSGKARPVTPQRSRNPRRTGTPASGATSVFYTPDSRVDASSRSTRSQSGHKISMTIVSTEDRDRWQARATRKKVVAATLRAVLEEKRKKATASSA